MLDEEGFECDSMVPVQVSDSYVWKRESLSRLERPGMDHDAPSVRSDL